MTLDKKLLDFINNHEKEINENDWLKLFNAAKTHLNEEEIQNLFDRLCEALEDAVLDITISKYIFTITQRGDYSMAFSEEILNFLKNKNNKEYLQNNDIKSVFARVKQINSHPQKTINARELFHCIVDKIAPCCFSNHNFINLNLQPFAKEFKEIKLYSKNTSLLNEISKASETDCLNELLSLMKKYHSYIDYYGKEEKNLIILIGETEKTITNDIKLKNCFDKYADILYEKARCKTAIPIDLFFLLAYHTIDKIEFKPKEDMTDWVCESHTINGHYHYPVHSKDVESSEVDNCCVSTSSKYTPEKASELMGCYIDRSWQNVNLDADNHNIYLCKEYIDEFSKKVAKKFNNGKDTYDAVFIITFLHEFGHLAFSHLDYETIYEGKGKTIHESRANFFPSYVINSIDMDKCIKQKVELQPPEYSKPLLYSEKDWETDTAINEIHP